MTKEYAIEVPFSDNNGGRCVPACTKMIIDYLRPDMQMTQKRAEEMSGFVEGRPTWAAQHLLSLHELGVEVGWIQDEALAQFAETPELYMRTQLGGSDEAYSRFAATNDVTLEAGRIGRYLSQGLPFEQRDASRKDIIERALGGYVVRLELNGKVLANQPGDTAHAVIVSGFSDDYVQLENPDSQYGQKPGQRVAWGVLEAAWQDYRILQYYRDSR